MTVENSEVPQEDTAIEIPNASSQLMLRIIGRIFAEFSKPGGRHARNGEGLRALRPVAPQGGVMLVDVRSVLSLQSLCQNDVTFALPPDPTLDPISGFLKGAGARVVREIQFDGNGTNLAVPIAIKGSKSASLLPGLIAEAVLRSPEMIKTTIVATGIQSKHAWVLDPGLGFEIDIPRAPCMWAQSDIFRPHSSAIDVISAIEFAADAVSGGVSEKATKVPPLFRVYQQLMRVLSLFSEPYLAWRARKGKEDPDRKDERFGKAGQPRNRGRYGWIHAASVGESVSILPMARRLLEFDGVDNLIVTTGTVTSAAVMENRLPAGAVHQFFPLDSPNFVQNFLDNWRPEFAIFTESELWPNMYDALTERDIPVAIVNGRISKQSFESWSRHPAFTNWILGPVELCAAQNIAYANRFARLGAPHVASLGNIKFDSPPLPVSEGDLNRMIELTKHRPVWLAASTHPGEEETIAEVHLAMRDRYPDLLTILAPRHPDRGEEVATLLEDLWLATARRSTGAEPRPRIDVYITDTIGELGLFYRLCPFAFIGGSLSEIGGQNPAEAANLGCAILHGPHTHNFTDMYDTFDEAGAAVKIADAGELLRHVDRLIGSKEELEVMTKAGQRVLDANRGTLDRTLKALLPLTERRRGVDA